MENKITLRAPEHHPEIDSNWLIQKQDSADKLGAAYEKLHAAYPYGKKLRGYPPPYVIAHNIVMSDAWENQWDGYRVYWDEFDVKSFTRYLAGVDSRKQLRKRVAKFIAEEYGLGLTRAQMRQVIQTERIAHDD